ncbi:helix-turn-helix transcriptional regulator [Corynebacterium urealyticum]|uniref:helix-turn-helix domain-containing protein n=1 Tax=Corynebacterium urealyticum TaxID=43771 RepID=UPI0002B3F374|nr:helix-turn-helix transcriptional regulator [Corynebacterium urealyticum]AGE37533.1 DNA-binding protein [Corynebacterium urealyticum DSM 7111]QQB08288.1 helix-turn-helix transcriptional regulator [Corynebacterium urealyticum]QQC41523.1 helix-turn-helix transcriptional regulator [Corynebacterium urealyticum]QQE50147.1 helix-turn-helix transcriptional regulator [Corynebacterium urealyticum]SNV84921.1 DNA-binding protein [Corynebacterium urealyticum]
MALAQRIKALRNKAGLSQAELADKLVVAREDVQGWESGDSAPDIEAFKRLAALFGVSTDDLLGNEGAVLGATTDRVAVDVKSLEKTEGRFLAKGTQAHTAVRQVFPHAVITPLLREKKNTKGETAMKWFTEIAFDGVPNFISEVKNSFSGDSFYLVEEASRTLLVRVTKDSVESREIFGQLSRRKFVLGRNSFIKFGKAPEN